MNTLRTAHDVAEELGVHYETILDWRKAGLITASHRVGSSYLFTQEDVDNRKKPRRTGRPRKQS